MRQKKPERFLACPKCGSNLKKTEVNVEGAEQKCLEGATKLLKEKPRILLEAHWAFLPRYGSDLQSLLKLVELHGYEKLWLDETHVANHYWLN